MKKEFKLLVGERIREQRILNGYSRESLAEIIDISPQFLADIERGVKSMSLITFKRMCAALAVSSDYILLGKTADYDAIDAIVDIVKVLDPQQYPIAEGMLRLLVRSTIISDKILSDEESNDSE